jgi:choline monooxygenase
MNTEGKHLSVDPNIARAKTLSTGFYTQAGHFEDSKEKIFSRAWHYLDTTESLTTPGQTRPVTVLPGFLNEPLMLVRDKGSALRCLSNVCTHRGALLIDKPCTLNDIRCRYHGRRFNLDGTFMAMPEFREVEDFPSASDHLTSLPLFTLGNLAFTTFGQKHNAADFFGPMQERLHWMSFSDFRFRADLSKDYRVKAHWALYCENYLEGFHIPFVHASLNQVIDYHNYSTELFGYSNLQLGIAKPGEMVFDLPPSSVDYGKAVAGYYFWVFPNLMFNFYPWGLSLNVVKPVSVNETVVSFLTFVGDESKLDQGAGSGLNRVEMEDEEVVESVQQGIRSRFYSHGRYSVRQEKGTHHFHRLIASFMNQE